MKPVITIDAYEPWMSYLLFEQYKEGYFKGLSEGLEIDQFAELLNQCATIGVSRMYLVNYNGNPVCVYECHRIPGTVYWDTHACWFTNRRKKRILTMYAFLEKIRDRDVLACVPKVMYWFVFPSRNQRGILVFPKEADFNIWANKTIYVSL
jgi:hypothetical protein